MKRFSQFFKLKKSQSELDFVDIPLDTDIKLFVDPYAISIREEPLFQECNELIVTFFQSLINAIKDNNKARAQYLLKNLSEPNETHFGHCENESKGAGVGHIQGNQLFEALYKSEAVKTGDLNSLSDCNLMIDGIAADKISDITINIIRKKLAEYTKEQCELYNIPIQNCSLKPYWDSKELNWKNDYYSLPVYKGKPILLCPKIMVRYYLLMDDSEFYEKNILNFLQAEHLKAGSSLVEALKNGNQRVTKKKLKQQEKYKKSKNFIFHFINKHPEILTEYKQEKAEKAHIAMSNEQFDNMLGEKPSNKIPKLITTLKKLNAGNEDATNYHNICIDILNVLFYPDLCCFKKEAEINNGRKRIDIIAQNISNDGFFKDIITKYNIKAPIIMLECKNYKNDIENPELDQLAGRLCERRGYFGILLCRKINNKENVLKKMQDYVKDEKKYMLVLEDIDIITLLNYKEQDNIKKIHEFLYAKINELIL